MKKRLRKKIHKGEFQQYGISIMVTANAENVDSIMDTIAEIAERHNIIFCGGGLSRLMLPSDKYGDLKIPSKVVFLAMTIVKDPQILSDCIVGYFINPVGKEIAESIADEVNAELEKTLEASLKINRRIGLWDDLKFSKLYANCKQMKSKSLTIFCKALILWWSL